MQHAIRGPPRGDRDGECERHHTPPCSLQCSRALQGTSTPARTGLARVRWRVGTTAAPQSTTGLRPLHPARCWLRWAPGSPTSCSPESRNSKTWPGCRPQTTCVLWVGWVGWSTMQQQGALHKQATRHPATTAQTDAHNWTIAHIPVGGVRGSPHTHPGRAPNDVFRCPHQVVAK